jgi:hypothetical protein
VSLPEASLPEASLPSAAEGAAVARGEPILDGEKVERLRSTVEATMWRADAELIAERMLDDAS